MIKKILFIVFLCLLVLVALYFYSATNTTDGNHNYQNKFNQTLKQEINHDLKGSITDKFLPVSRPTNEILDFNHYLINSVSAIGTSTDRSILNALNGTIDEKSIDEAVNELKKIKDDPAKYQLVMRDLYAPCNAIKSRENGTLAPDSKTMLSGEYLLLALQSSDYCSILMTDKDPFFLTLELARKGDKLAQLFLADDLYFAIHRGLINPKLYPLKYNDLRTEIIDYQRRLSATGVEIASAHLKRLYSDYDYLLPEDKVLEYYYTVLAEKQSNDRFIFMDGSSVLYDRLTESEKDRADRLTKKLK